MSCRPTPYSSTTESGRYLHHVTIFNAKSYFASVRDQFDHIAIGTFVDSLGHQRLEPGPNLSRRQVAGGCNELNPERHGSFAAVAQFENSTARYSAVVHEVEHTHLIQIEYDLELVA